MIPSMNAVSAYERRISLVSIAYITIRIRIHAMIPNTMICFWSRSEVKVFAVFMVSFAVSICFLWCSFMDYFMMQDCKRFFRYFNFFTDIFLFTCEIERVLYNRALIFTYEAPKISLSCRYLLAPKSRGVYRIWKNLCQWGHGAYRADYRPRKRRGKNFRFCRARYSRPGLL